MFNVILYTLLLSSFLLFLACISFLTIGGYSFTKHKTIDIKDVIESILTIIAGIVSIGFFVSIIKLL